MRSNTHAASARELRICHVGDVGLHCLDRGQGEPVVLLHGGMGDVLAWGAQQAAFAAAFRVISYSRRYSYPNRNAFDAANNGLAVDVGDLAALLDSLSVGAAHFVGTSYGALVALAHALARPRAVKSLVLAEPPLHAWLRRTPDGEMLYRNFLEHTWKPAGVAFDAGLPRQAIGILVDGIWGSAAFGSMPERITAQLLRNAPAMAALVRASAPFPDLDRAAVRELEVPMLVVRGERAARIHRQVNEELAHSVPRAQQAVIAAAGHGSPRENPDGFNAAVLGFLAGLRQ